jgi:soluble lytic murein transglycosylase-like protein
MLRVQQLLIPAVLLGCLTVILVTNLVYQPEKVNAVTLSNNDANILTQSGSSSNCDIAASYPAAVRQWCSLIDNYTQEQNLDPDLIAAVILEESGGNPLAYSSSGAVGLMQIMPRDGLATGFSCGSSPCFSSRPSMNELYDPEFNIAYGVRMLGSLYRKYGNVRDALLAYGPANVGYYYADIVLGIYARYK